MRTSVLPLVLALTLCNSVAPAADDLIWIEGESAKTRTVSPHSWYESIKKNKLSGGAWVYNFGKADGLVDYEFQAPAPGDYTFWVRANPIGSKLSYKLNGGDWTLIVTNKDAHDSVNLAIDDKPDMRYLAWFNVGKVALKAGANTVSFKMHSENSHHGAIDCFLFTTKPFRPNGALKPGQKLGLTEPGKWAFEPDDDAFDPKALLDLRGLNEKVAGESGWLKCTGDREFALGNGQPVRFWAVNSGVHRDPDKDALRNHARFLAKRGVNMVRFHGSIWPKVKDSRLTDVDASEIEHIQRVVAAMKAEGVYTTVSVYWAIPARAQANWGLKGHPLDKNLTGMLFWDEDLQRGYKAWLKELLTRPNPHTGVPLGKDPAMAILQLQNEDSLLFWTMQSIQGEELRRLGQIHGKWVIGKYGSIDKAKEAWGGTTIKGDDFAASVVSLMIIWEYTQPQSGGKTVRLADQLQFLSETMYAFNKGMEDYVHDELKCPVLINSGNWCTADQIKLLDAERWSYTANAVIGKNHYVNGVHVNPTEGQKAGYLVSRGDFFEDFSMLNFPRKLATNVKLVAGRPFIVSESTWVPPLSYSSEGPFLVAAYSSLTGFDAYYWFATGSVGYDRTINKWQFANPSMLGGFPAASLMFRRGYVRRGQPVVHEERRMEDVWNSSGLLLAEDESFDPSRHSGLFAKESNVKSGVGPLAYLAGPVEVVYGGDPAKNRIADLSKCIDEQKKQVTSITGQIKLDYGLGLCTLDAPKAQGATGFLSKAGAIQLSSVGITSANEYATILAVSMDDKDLKESGKVLVQATTTCRPYGWKETATTFQDKDRKHTFNGKRIDDTGSEPWNVANTDATLTVRNAKLSRAVILDINGMPVGDAKGLAQGDAFTLKLPPNAMYVVLE